MADIEVFERSREALRDWRKAIRNPVTRVGNIKRINLPIVILTALIIIYFFILFYSILVSLRGSVDEPRRSQKSKSYNSTYPFTEPTTENGTLTYVIGLISDLDNESKSDHGAFDSYLKRGFLNYQKDVDFAMVSWDLQLPTILKTSYSYQKRGMELSELIVFDGRLLAFDDRSGIVFEIVQNKVIPWVILADADGRTEKGFKAEWATVKDELLYVGSTGQEMVTDCGDFLNNNPMWIKTINTRGEVHHINWENQYIIIKTALEIRWPGYVFHESGVWSSIAKKWYFLPRKCSKEMYNKTTAELRGCNFLISTDDDFRHIGVQEVGKLEPKLGFSSFKFIPGTNDKVIVALKTTEFQGETATYIMVFKTNGQVLVEDTFVENEKYEGIEFL